MKQLSEGVQQYGESKGYEILVQDPNLDPKKQVTDLQSVTTPTGTAWSPSRRLCSAMCAAGRRS